MRSHRDTHYAARHLPLSTAKRDKPSLLKTWWLTDRWVSTAQQIGSDPAIKDKYQFRLPRPTGPSLKNGKGLKIILHCYHTSSDHNHYALPITRSKHQLHPSFCSLLMARGLEGCSNRVTRSLERSEPTAAEVAKDRIWPKRRAHIIVG